MMKELLLLLLMTVPALACPPQCLNCDKSGRFCLSCSVGFEWKQTGTCVDSKTIPNCTLYGLSNECLECQPTFALKNGGCEKDYSGCASKNAADPKKCDTCGYGTLPKNSECIGPINCKSRKEEECTDCIEGFKFADGQCKDTSENCLSLGTNGLCEGCKDGFSLVGYTCIQKTVPPPQNCYIYDSNGVSQKCKRGFPLVQGKCPLSKELVPSIDPNCIAVTADYKCKICSKDYYLNSSLFCNEKQQVCLTSNSKDGTCESCFAGFELKDKKCIQKQNDPHCQNILENGICLTCKKDYVYGQTKKCNWKQWAKQCDSNDPFDSSYCSLCNDGFKTIKGKCIKLAQKEEPQKKKDIQKIANCQVSFHYGCVDCKKSWIWSPERWKCQLDKRDPMNCLANYDGNFCDCGEGMVWNVMEGCKKKGGQLNLVANCEGYNDIACVKCKTGHNINFQGNCILIDPNCVKWDYMGNVCILCGQIYFGNGAVCIKDQSVNPPTCPPNCLGCDTSGKYCFACGEGFEVKQDGTCVDANTIPKCAFYGLSNQCLQCQPTYFLLSGACQKEYSGCLSYQRSTYESCPKCGFGTIDSALGCLGPISCTTRIEEKCSNCISGFILSGDKCQDVSGKCQQKRENGLCAVCNTDFKLIGYRCLADSVASPNCYIYDPYGTCQFCKKGFLLTSGKCFLPTMQYFSAKDPNCIAEKEGFRCKICSKHYYLDYGLQCVLKQYKCLTYNPINGACLSCYNEYTLDGKMCIKENDDPNCQRIRGSCQSCKQDYFFDQTKKCYWKKWAKNCKNFDIYDASYCSLCEYGFKTIKGKCFEYSKLETKQDLSDITSIPNCQKMRDYGCQKCKQVWKWSPERWQCQLDKRDPINCLEYYDGNFCDCGANMVWNVINGCTKIGGINIVNNCEGYNNTGCAKCTFDYYLDSKEGCILIDPNCDKWDYENNKCFSCRLKFAQAGSGCIDQTLLIDDCIKYKGTQCTNCREKFYLDKNGKCAEKDVNCVSWDDATNTCRQCIYLFKPKGQQCISPCLQNCLSCDPNGRCIACANGFEGKQDGTCMDATTISYCTLYSIKDECLDCQPTYNLVGGQCQKDYSGCLVKNPTKSTLCLKCGFGTFLQNFKCLPPINCITRSGDKCIDCAAGFGRTSEGVCLDITGGCKTIGEKKVCEVCNTGFNLIGYKCIKESVSSPNCYLYDQYGDCYSCKKGFRLSSGKCLEDTSLKFPNCIALEASSQCRLCSKDYYLDSDLSCKPRQKNCLTSSPINGSCLSCYDWFGLNGSKCQKLKDDPNCQQLGKPGACQYCKIDYVFDFKKNCIWKQWDKDCDGIDEYDGFYCVDCIKGLKNIKGKCIKLADNEQPQKLQDSPSIPNCQTRRYYGCQICSKGWIWRPERWRCQWDKKDPLNCVDYYDGNQCVCGQNMVWNVMVGCIQAGDQVKIDLNLKCWGYNNTGCVRCMADYYLGPTGSCVLIDPNCAVWNFINNTCRTCYADYTWNSLQCVFGTPSEVLRCGDGLITGSEKCDDNNTADGDGCSSTCQIQTNYTCTASPSFCYQITSSNLKLQVITIQANDILLQWYTISARIFTDYENGSEIFDFEILPKETPILGSQTQAIRNKINTFYSAIHFKDSIPTTGFTMKFSYAYSVYEGGATIKVRNGGAN